MQSAASKSSPFIIGVGGLTSNVGKTTLVCDLLKYFPGWEAIKTTRGHYRSCGKDPHACCVSHLLTDEPIVRSGYDATYTAGKDTGRYWEAGASNVHWLIATDDQVEKGIGEAVNRVESPGVLIEGNSFTQFVKPDYFVMVVRPDSQKVKSTARRAMQKVNAVYVSTVGSYDLNSLKHVTDFSASVSVFSTADLVALVEEMRTKIYATSGAIKQTDKALFAS